MWKVKQDTQVVLGLYSCHEPCPQDPQAEYILIKRVNCKKLTMWVLLNSYRPVKMTVSVNLQLDRLSTTREMPVSMPVWTDVRGPITMGEVTLWPPHKTESKQHPRTVHVSSPLDLDAGWTSCFKLLVLCFLFSGLRAKINHFFLKLLLSECLIWQVLN